MVPQILALAILFGQPADDSTTLINRELAVGWRDNKLTPAINVPAHAVGVAAKQAFQIIHEILVLSQNNN